MAKTDYRINKHGVDVADLHVGQWVEVEWNDAPNSKVVIIRIEERSPAYLGERDMDVLIPYGDKPNRLEPKWRRHFAAHTQVVRILGDLKAPV